MVQLNKQHNALQFIKQADLTLLTSCKAAWYIISRASVCNTLTFESLDVGRIFAHPVYLEWIVSGSYIKVKVTGAKMIYNPYSCNVKL